MAFSSKGIIQVIETYKNALPKEEYIRMCLRPGYRFTNMD